MRTLLAQIQGSLVVPFRSATSRTTRRCPSEATRSSPAPRSSAACGGDQPRPDEARLELLATSEKLVLLDGAAPQVALVFLGGDDLAEARARTREARALLATR